MARYTKKYTLLDIADSGLLNGYLPNLSDYNKYYTRQGSKGNVVLKNRVSIDDIESQIVKGVVAQKPNIKGTKYYRGKIRFSFKESDYNKGVDTYNEIVAIIKGMKSSLKYVHTFESELKSAYKYSITEVKNKREAPKLALKIKDLKQVEGMTPIQKRNLVYQIIECILFDDEFAKTQGYTQSNRGRYGVPKTQGVKYRYWKTLKRDYDERTSK